GTGPFHSWGVRVMSGPLGGSEGGQAQERVVSGNYFTAVGIRLLAGRSFDARDVSGASNVVVVSQSLADKMFPGVDPIGQRILTGGREAAIVGVVSEVAIDNEGRSGPFVYHPHAQFAGDRNWALTQVITLSDSRKDILPAVRRTLSKMDPELVVHHAMML